MIPKAPLASNMLGLPPAESMETPTVGQDGIGSLHMSILSSHFCRADISVPSSPCVPKKETAGGVGVGGSDFSKVALTSFTSLT